MELLNGINHAGILTTNLSRWLEFYCNVFEAEVVFEETTPQFRHAIVKIGPHSMLHVLEVAGGPQGSGTQRMLPRGFLDHLGLDVASKEAFEEIRWRLVQRGASDGAVLDLGPQLNVQFVDPDGIQVEVCWVRDPKLQGFHAPQPFSDSV